IRPVRMSENSHEDAIWIARIDSNVRDLLCILEAEVVPGLAGVGGFIYSVADGEIGSMQPFTTADVDDVGVARRHGDRADGLRRLIVENWIPCAPGVVALPHAAVDFRDIENHWRAGDARDGARAAAAKWADHAPAHFLE